jgi:branched-chain amino acid transport system permease protein
MSLRKPLLALAVLAGIAVLAAAPALGLGEYVLALGISFATFAVLSSGLNLVYGYTGMMSYGQVGFFGIGGYTAALLVQDHGIGFIPALFLGGVLATSVSLLLGYTALRLSRHAFSIVSLSFSLLCVILARDWVEVTRGPMGIPGLAAPMIALPGDWHVTLSRPVDFYYAAMLVALAAHAVVFWIATSRIGRAMRAVKLNEPLAQSQGISPVGLKLLAIGVSAFLAAVMGGVFVFYLTIVDPSIFDFYYTEAMLIMVIVGGAGSFWCVLLATAVFTVVPDLLRFTTDLRMVLYGVILIAAMLVMPGGLGGWLRARQIARWRHPGRARALRKQMAAGPDQEAA